MDLLQLKMLHARIPVKSQILNCSIICDQIRECQKKKIKGFQGIFVREFSEINFDLQNQEGNPSSPCISLYSEGT